MRTVLDQPRVERDNATEYEVHRFVAEASDIGLPVGRFPLAIGTSLGNGQPFTFDHADRDGDGDLTACHYRQRLGCITLTVFND